MVTNLFTSVWNHGYPWGFASKYQVLQYGDNNFYTGSPLSANPYAGENYYPYSPFSLNNAIQFTFAVSAKV